MPQPAGATAFAQRLRRAREEAGLTQKEAARRIGISQNVLSRVERSEYVGTDLTIVAAARVFAIDEHELLRLAEDARDPVVASIAKSDRLGEEAKRELLERYRELAGDPDPGPSEQRVLLSASDAAQMLSVTVPVVTRLVAEGELELVHLGRLPRITVRSLHALVERRSKDTERRLRGAQPGGAEDQFS